MKVTKYYCDICKLESNDEFTPFKLEGYVSSSIFGNVTPVLHHCCNSCRYKLLDNIREIFDKTVNELENL